jgi:hypothetical protein
MKKLMLSLALLLNLNFLWAQQLSTSMIPCRSNDEYLLYVSLRDYNEAEQRYDRVALTGPTNSVVFKITAKANQLTYINISNPNDSLSITSGNYFVKGNKFTIAYGTKTYGCTVGSQGF